MVSVASCGWCAWDWGEAGNRYEGSYTDMIRKIEISASCKRVLAAMAILFSLCVGEAPAGQDTTALRLALLPIPDVLPLYVAEEKGYFAEEDVQVEPLPVGSAVERDQLMQAGRIDGMINEVSGAALFNRQSRQMVIISYARQPMGTAPLFRVLAAPGSNIGSVGDLAGVDIGVSKNTVIEYITDRLLAAKGLDDTQIRMRSVPVVPERFQLLLAGQIEAATLPDPLGFAAIEAGAVEIANDTEVAHLSASVISFSAQAVDAKAEQLKKFMVAWDRAVADINNDPEGYRELMLAKIRVPGNVRQTFPIPPLPRGAVPSRSQWDDANSWLMKKGLLKEPVSYDVSVTDRFLAR